MLPLALVSAGVAVYRASAISDLKADLLRVAKEALDEFVSGSGGQSAIAKAVGRDDAVAVSDLKTGFVREMKSRGALAGVTVEEVDVTVTDEGDVSTEIRYRAGVAGISSRHRLALADSFTPVKPETPPPATDLTAGVNIPYARPVTSMSRPAPPRPTGAPIRFYQPLRPAPIPNPVRVPVGPVSPVAP